jgi:hypothetical protein
MVDRFERTRVAISTALEYCRDNNINWRKHLKPVIRNKEIIGYQVRYKNSEFTVKI